MKRRVIFHVSANDYPPLKMAHHTRAIWNELSRNTDAYHVIARGLDNRFHHEQDGVLHLHRLPAFGNGQLSFLFTQWFLLWLCWKYRPTHLLAQCPVLGGLAAALWAWAIRVPLMVELHGTHYFAADKPGVRGLLRHIFFRVAARPAFSVARYIRTLSADMTEQIGVIYGSNVASQAIEIPPRVNLDKFQPKQDYKAGAILKLISVGGMVPNKNHIALIDDLLSIGQSVSLTLVGSGPLLAVHAARVSALAARGLHLKLAGEVEHVALAHLLREADIYVHYSLAEGVPRAILEAMAVGLPVITAPVGFLTGVIESGSNGLILASHGTEPLDAALRLLASEAERSHIGRNARMTVQDKFEWQKVFARYRATLCDELEDKKSRS